MRETKAIIHLDNIRSNIDEIRKYTGSSVPICVPVKADAYGHGAVQVSRALIAAGVRFLAVATVSEGVELRQAGINVAILLLSIPAPQELPLVAEFDFIPLVPDADFATLLDQAASAAQTKLTVHLKIDSGMGRIGCLPNEAVSVAKAVVSAKHLRLGGCCTHLPVADSFAFDDETFTSHQIVTFADAVQQIRDAGIDPGIVHAASSGGILRYPESYFDMIRPGILVYGYPSDPALAELLPLKPVMEFSSYISSLRLIPAGSSVSYGRTWIAPHDTWIGTIPVGYADGWCRGLSNKVSVTVRGVAYPVVGRICMDQCMVDFGPDPVVQRWDHVTLFGGCSKTSAADIATLLDTIPYEVTCNIAHRVPRVYAG